ncbi:hypothetical protein AMTRI_Chr09g33090 [Amborella trichopoda]
MGSSSGAITSDAHIATVLMIALFSSSMMLLCKGEHLSSNFYDSSCPNALSTIRIAIRTAISAKRRMGASLICLHFHDCFVNGCDASVLLDSTSSFESEQNAIQNVESTRGFKAIENAKLRVESKCPGVVSCADILAVAARDASVAMGGPSWTVKLGRRDSATASKSDAERELPLFTAPLDVLICLFGRKGLSAKDMVALSGAHTIGQAQRGRCPLNGGDSNLAPLDLVTPTSFDNNYFKILMRKKGLLESDQVLFNGGSTDDIVRSYSNSRRAFYSDFAAAMVKMGDIEPLTGSAGQIRASAYITTLLMILLCTSSSMLLVCEGQQLTSNFYDSTCPNALSTIRTAIRTAISAERRMGASLIRLHFHDCFVNGCDASLLLDSTSSFESEQNAIQNINSARGFHVIENAKSRVESICPGVVSCSDILAVAARDSSVAKGTQCQRHGCSLRCTHHRPSPVLHIQRQNLQPHQHRCRLCSQKTCFDNNYFKILMQKKGLLESDQVLFNGGSTDDIVRSYSNSRSAFYSDFAAAMVKMGDIEPLTGSAGQIRARCSVPN